MKENITRVAESDVDYNENVHLLTDNQKKTIALGLVISALSGPMVGQVRAESDVGLPSATITEVGLMPSQEVKPVSEAEKTELRKMIMDFKGVDSMDLPYETIRRMVVEADDRKYSEYRQILRESGCTDSEVIEDHAKWMYGVDNDNDDTLNNSKTPEGYGFLRNYVTHKQIIHHALTGEGLNVYTENGKSILFVNTSEQGEKAFRAAIDWYKKNGVENIVDLLSEKGFCIWFPHFFQEDGGPGTTLVVPEMGEINQNFDINYSRKMKDDGLRDQIIYILAVESIAISHGQVMMALTGDNLFEFTHGLDQLEIVKCLMMGYNFDYLYKKNGDEKYKMWSESYKSQAEYFVQMFNTSINNPYIVRQLEMMTIGGLTRPFGAENWDFIKDDIEALK